MHEILCSITYIYWEVLYDMTCLKSDQKYVIYIAINCGKRQVTIVKSSVSTLNFSISYVLNSSIFFRSWNWNHFLLTLFDVTTSGSIHCSVFEREFYKLKYLKLVVYLTQYVHALLVSTETELEYDKVTRRKQTFMLHLMA